MKRVVLFLFLCICFYSSSATNWYVRPDGGTRYSSNVPTGQCNGQSDAAYPGSGVNQPCAYAEFRYLWDDHSGQVGAGSWVISGGDTVLVEGCHAEYTQPNASNPNCRLGWDKGTGDGDNTWCYGVGSYTCYNPPIPAGTAGQHTRILGKNYATCSQGGTDPKGYVRNLTQLYGGFSQTWAFNLSGTQYVDIQCIELTTHNGVCVRAGYPQYPRGCSNSQPLDDFAGNGILFDPNTANVSLQDVYIHGFTASGIHGPFGAGIVFNRVRISMNAFAGWNWADANNTPNAANASFEGHYVFIIGNGCYEEYPIVHDFPAMACYDDQSGGFGDGLSGQDTDMGSFSCDHCTWMYNVKDAFFGPHVNPTNITVTNSINAYNMGAEWKFDTYPNATALFRNNLTVGSCSFMSGLIPGAAHSFAQSSGLPGAYLSDFCRAGGNSLAYNIQEGTSLTFDHNTFVTDNPTLLLTSCGKQGNNHAGNCGTAITSWTNNIVLGYNLTSDPNNAPGLFYIDDASVNITSSNSLFYGVRNTYGYPGLPCTGTNVCNDPLFVNEPVQQVRTDHAYIAGFNFTLSSSSPAKGIGTSSGATTDFMRSNYASPASVGALEYGSSYYIPTPSVVSVPIVGSDVGSRLLQGVRVLGMRF